MGDMMTIASTIPAIPGHGERSRRPPDGLAGQSYSISLPDGDLDLRWTLDEAEWLDPPLERMWSELLGADPAALTAIARHYAVDDPYGGRRAGDLLSQHFHCRLDSEQVTFGAGCSSLLHELAALAAGGSILTANGSHPDLSAWAHAANIPIRWQSRHASMDEWISEASSLVPTVIHLDRPTMWGDARQLSEIRELCQRAPRSIVIIDEAYGSYWPVAKSAVQLVPQLDNLLVLRSFSKGYCCGGLRVGYVIASESVAGRVRQVVSPLQVSELSYQLALQLLRAGDVFARLRRRIQFIKPQLIAWASSLGSRLCVGDPDLPWMLVDDAGSVASAWFRTRRIAAKPCEFGWGDGVTEQWIRVAVPLSDRRVKECAQRLEHSGSDGDGLTLPGGRAP
jgi:histidinol-phosphate/aromatic aminotransferase/cobyric acid decarboxylase-like protein